MEKMISREEGDVGTCVYIFVVTVGTLCTSQFTSRTLTTLGVSYSIIPERKEETFATVNLQ